MPQIFDSSGSGSLQSVPTPVQFNPAAAVADGQPLANMSAGIDFGGKLLRVAQLKDQLALEDLNRKADAAKAKAAAAEADLIHSNLATAYAAQQKANEAALIEAQIRRANAGSLADVTVPPGGIADVNAGTAATNAQVASEMAKLNLGLTKSFAQTAQPGQPIPVSQAGAPVPTGEDLTGIGLPALPENAPAVAAAAWNTAQRNAWLKARADAVSKGSFFLPQAPNPKDVFDSAFTTENIEHTAPDGSKYKIQNVYAPDASGNRTLVAQRKLSKESLNPAQVAESARSPELTDLLPAASAIDQAIADVTAYKAANASGPMQTLATIAAPDGQVRGAKSLLGVLGQSAATQKIITSLAAVHGTLNSAQRKDSIKGLADDAIPTGATAANSPDAALAKLYKLKVLVADRAKSLASSTASTAITTKSGNPPRPTEGQVKYLPTGQKVVYSSNAGGWVVGQ